MKYILVHGGVISGVGKGIISSSIGTLMKSLGLRVTAIKIDPYINIDAGTFNPYEHGEVGSYVDPFFEVTNRNTRMCNVILALVLRLVNSNNASQGFRTLDPS